jgi:hypothetical protein
VQDERQNKRECSHQIVWGCARRLATRHGGGGR